MNAGNDVTMIANSLEDLKINIKGILDRVEAIENTLSLRTSLISSTHKSLLLPLEIIGIILEYLTQQDVYPFLSLSKSVNYVARARLLRQVYVLPEGQVPNLHESNKDLKLWLMITTNQFIMIVETFLKWPGKVVVLDQPLFSKSLIAKIKEKVAPAQLLVVNKISMRPNSMFDHLQTIKAINEEVLKQLSSKANTSFTFSPTVAKEHLSRLTLVGPSFEFSKLHTKLDVDCLEIFGEVNGIDEFINLGSIRQLTVASACVKYNLTVYQLASQFTQLKDLCIAGSFFGSQFIPAFPKTLQRLVVHWITGFPTPWTISSGTSHYKAELTYLEICLGTNFPTNTWPRPSLRVGQDPKVDTDEILEELKLIDFAQLAVVVIQGRRFLPRRVLGEWYETVEV